MDSKSKYKAWEQWTTNAMQSLTEMNADSRSTTMATFSAPTPVLLADSQPAPTGGVMVSNSDFRVLLAKVETTMGKVETMEARQNAA